MYLRYWRFRGAKQRVDESIELILNRERLHLVLGYLEPMEFEEDIESPPWHVSVSAPTCPS